MTTKFTKDFFAALIFLVLGVLMFTESYKIKQLSFGIEIGSDFVPKLIAIGIMGMSLILLIQNARKKGLAKQAQATEKQQEDKGMKVSFYGTIGLLTIYVTLLEKIGFVPMTMLYLFIQMNLLKSSSKKNQFLIAGLSIICTLLVYYLFKNILYLMLPEGILG
ncbi:tripartite tricarboxylate transporter TctB family protein [Ammoniphilus resinae]|uniref:Mannose/fructose/N-acetylgalactosamine-specific phosphotransferase system component IIC n=1 Tax=Ammoniphilus resinae TaxID=861532 RepID=A0ABS4GNR8_9BACL|nr:tripartite tricarboxylate transporter TctB family protein [Ammoniphilus resinae]MBP1931923.1 mannose/fructose/N-acetylgalactosamine-specific phosphotransferase system component IIC [Ammoniphilus resinae]